MHDPLTGHSLVVENASDRIRQVIKTKIVSILWSTLFHDGQETHYESQKWYKSAFRFGERYSTSTRTSQRSSTELIYSNGRMLWLLGLFWLPSRRKSLSLRGSRATNPVELELTNLHMWLYPWLKSPSALSFLSKYSCFHKNPRSRDVSYFENKSEQIYWDQEDRVSDIFGSLFTYRKSTFRHRVKLDLEAFWFLSRVRG